VSSPNLSLNLSLCDSIVTIVGEIVTRASFSSRGSMRSEWQRSGLTRIGAVVKSVPAWGDATSRSQGSSLERAVRPAWRGAQTSPVQGGAVKPAWLGGQIAPPPEF
jgi:CelD/BcsL family acetyltransferase involved in cellulose biosynthesis